ncbi:unnamed protein product [Cercospora beticola]|nr:unnamed protein product [Cercospora beticola]
MVNPDFLELGGEAVNALVETETGEKVIGKVSNTKWSDDSSISSSDDESRRRSRKDSRRDSVHDGRRSRARKDDREEKWSIKSFFRSSRHQQKPLDKKTDDKPRKSKSSSKTKTTTAKDDNETQEQEKRLEQRRERFRAAKTRYVPPETIRREERLHFKQDRLNAEVEMAVAAAKRRSEDAGREK